MIRTQQHGTNLTQEQVFSPLSPVRPMLLEPAQFDGGINNLIGKSKYMKEKKRKHS